MTADGYKFLGGQSIIYSNDVNAASVTTTVNDYNSSSIILGVRGFDGFPILSNTQWGWTLLNVSTTETATLTLDKKQLQNIYFSFFQISKYVTTTEPGS